MLHEKQIKAVNLFLEGHGVSYIARTVGVSRQTIYDWQKVEEFISELDKRSQEKKDSASRLLDHRVKDYISALEEIAMNSKSDKTRSEALQYLIDRSLGKPTSKTQDISDKQQDSKSNQDVGWQELEQQGIRLKKVK